MKARSLAAVLTGVVVTTAAIAASVCMAPAATLNNPPAVGNPGPPCGVPLLAAPDMACMTTAPVA